MRTLVFITLLTLFLTSCASPRIDKWYEVSCTGDSRSLFIKESYLDKEGVLCKGDKRSFIIQETNPRMLRVLRKSQPKQYHYKYRKGDNRGY